MTKPSKIILINYPCRGFQIGEECDFGEEINTSLVGQQRAVWKDNRLNPPLIVKPAKVSAEPQEKPVAPSQQHDETPKETSTKPKKLLQNKLEKEIQSKPSKDSKSFWDRLK